MSNMLGDSRLDSPKRLARRDKAIIKNKGIESPDVDEMLPLVIGKTTYYFRTEKKRNDFINKNKHDKITGYKFDNDEETMEKVPGVVVKDNKPEASGKVSKGA